MSDVQDFAASVMAFIDDEQAMPVWHSRDILQDVRKILE